MSKADRTGKLTEISQSAAGKFLGLPSADVLSIEEANQITRSAMTRVIVPIGFESVGKTTLLAEVYEKFNVGEFAGMRFTSSMTLHGFEQRAHLARAASGLGDSTTERTRFAEPEFLHLELTPIEDPSSSRDILFADCAGEVFPRNARRCSGRQSESDFAASGPHRFSC